MPSVERQFIAHYAEVRRRLIGRPQHDPGRLPPPPKPVPPRIVHRPVILYRPQAWKRICVEVCAKHMVSFEQLIGTQRRMWQGPPRREAMWRVRNEMTVNGLPPSWTQIGLWFERDHSTVIYQVKRYERENGL